MFKWLCKRSAPHQVRCSLTGKSSAIPNDFIPPTVGNKCKKTETNRPICYLKTEKEKRYNEQPTHKTTSRLKSGQKSSFLADALQEIEYLADYKFWTMKYETSHTRKSNFKRETFIGEFHVTIKNQSITHEI